MLRSFSTGAKINGRAAALKSGHPVKEEFTMKGKRLFVLTGTLLILCALFLAGCGEEGGTIAVTATGSGVFYVSASKTEIDDSFTDYLYASSQKKDRGAFKYITSGQSATWNFTEDGTYWVNGSTEVKLSGGEAKTQTSVPLDVPFEDE
jgi:hypothetical protein